jgi:hypothetical protein
MQALYAGYAAAGTGRKIQMPYQPKGNKPIEEWLGTNLK